MFCKKLLKTIDFFLQPYYGILLMEKNGEIIQSSSTLICADTYARIYDT